MYSGRRPSTLDDSNSTDETAAADRYNIIDRVHLVG